MRKERSDNLPLSLDQIELGRTLAWANLCDADGEPEVEEIQNLLVWECEMVLRKINVWHNPGQILLAQRFEEGGEACTAAIGFFKREMAARKFFLDFGYSLNSKVDKEDMERIIKACEVTIKFLAVIRSEAPELGKELPVPFFLYRHFGVFSPTPITRSN